MRPPDRPNVKYIAVNTSDPDDPDEPVIKTKRRRKSGKYIFALFSEKVNFCFPTKKAAKSSVFHICYSFQNVFLRLFLLR